MTQIHQRRTSASPYIDIIWHTQNVGDGTYLATPDGSWDLIAMTDVNGKSQMLLTGQASKTAHIPYKAGTSSVVISFSAGAYLPHLPGGKLVDTAELLPNADDNHFILGGHIFAFPTFDNAETLVEELIDTGVLKNDEVVSSVVQGVPAAISKRAIQRHFVQTTGVTQKRLERIKRAQQAVKLIKQGMKPVDAAVDAGYADQPHLAKSLKKLMDSNPSDLDQIHKL
jgi:hypothetical protein